MDSKRKILIAVLVVGIVLVSVWLFLDSKIPEKHRDKIYCEKMKTVY